VDWSSTGRAPSLVHKLLRAESLAPHHANGNAWHSTRSSTPDNDLLYVSSTTPRLSGIDILIAYLRPHHEEYEHFSALGGSTPTHSRTDDVWSTRTSPRSTAAQLLTPALTTRGLLRARRQHSYSRPYRRSGHLPETARAGSRLRGNLEPQ
jgi:hypothetical protein